MVLHTVPCFIIRAPRSPTLKMLSHYWKEKLKNSTESLNGGLSALGSIQ